MTDDPLLHVGTAGWQVPRNVAPLHAATGAHLERYASLFNATEVNTTFYRPHLSKTFERWAAMVSDDFRFAVKMHKSITHEQRLADIRPAQVFLDMVSALGHKLGPVLVQLPPSLAWSTETEDFLSALREVHGGELVLEARHPSWAASDAVKALMANAISGVAADPPRLCDELRPSGHPDTAYFRLHGSPRMYWSAYSDAFLKHLAQQIGILLGAGRKAWVIFDNTAAGAGVLDALRLKALVGKG
ncbi:MAG: DUF72 domain-containing protein [Flavobacteriales bacterium]|jgi:uncharacterized protein YecE (DUF72 family)|nr:DUF72 domain-containing protein [Flavobacteriales bacterium]